MNKGIASVSIALLTLGSSAAQAATKCTTAIGVFLENKRIEIKIEDLPVSVSKELAASYAGAELLKAYKWHDDKGDIMGYEVLLKTIEAKELTVKFGPNGEPAK